jgi:diaminopimelate epimerase
MESWGGARGGGVWVGRAGGPRGGGGARGAPGTGACAVMVTAALDDGAPRGTAYRVDLPGGSLEITWTEDDRVFMTGPAVIVATGETDL